MQERVTVLGRLAGQVQRDDGTPVPTDTATWADVYRTERDGLVRLAYLMTGSGPVAEDLVQDCFVRVMARLEPADGPGAYLRRSVINACYSHHRRAWREVGVGDDPSEAGDPENPYGRFRPPGRPGATEDRSPSADIEMWDALGRLPTRRRAVLVMRFYLDMSEAEVAASLGCRVGTVKSTTSRALDQLRKVLR